MKRIRIMFLVISISFCLLLIGFLGIRIYGKTKELKTNELQVSENQLVAADPNLLSRNNDEYFELTGYGQLDIDESYPYLNLINSKNNAVYLSYEVRNNDNVLYNTKLIEPGKMEQFNIYKCLDAGEHTINYSIDVYDLDKHILWSGINLEQNISIKK